MKSNLLLFTLMNIISISYGIGQSYLYVENASGPSLNYTRIDGSSVWTVDLTHKGWISGGLSIISNKNSNRSVAFNSALNIVKYDNERRSISVPILLGFSRVNENNIYSYGGGIFAKSKIKGDFQNAIGISYVNSKSKYYFDTPSALGLDLYVFWKSLYLNPYVSLSKDEARMGLSVGAGFNHNGNM